jgi:N-acetylglucosaminyldiphosphoundecaprenol N-acetyl-beta-D-mannosaminyltransferase
MTTAAAAVPAARREVLGTQVHALTMPVALEWIRTRIEARDPTYVVTLNGAMLVQTARDERWRVLANDAGLVTADGVAVLLAARILGVRISERVAGIDLVVALCEQAARCGHRVFLFGGRAGVAADAARVLQRRFPALNIVGASHGFYDAGDDETVREAVRAARPDLLLVALGMPRQEQWMRRWHRELQVPVSVGVGGSFDVLAGVVRRAPRWAQRLGLEWLYRALLEPRRWQVIATIPPLFWMALWRRLRGPRA